MFNKKVIDTKQKKLSDFLSVSTLNKKSETKACNESENMNKNAPSKRSLRRPGLVYLESSSSEEEEHIPRCSRNQSNEKELYSESFTPSPRKYKFSSINDIIKEDKNYQNAMDKIEKNLIDTNPPIIKKIVEDSTFLNDSISPIKSQHPESSLIAKYLGESAKESSTVTGKCFYLIGKESDNLKL